jgi:16S rRNA (adenine1518-N6/adenine1519-N6)-dimethyltransferase
MPNVDSAILKVDEISKDSFKTLDEAWFFKVLKAGFSARRKQLRGNLSAVASKEAIDGAFQAVGIPEKARGEDLSIDVWLALAARLAA